MSCLLLCSYDHRDSNFPINLCWTTTVVQLNNSTPQRTREQKQKLRGAALHRENPARHQGIVGLAWRCILLEDTFQAFAPFATAICYSYNENRMNKRGAGSSRSAIFCMKCVKGAEQDGTRPCTAVKQYNGRECAETKGCFFSPLHSKVVNYIATSAARKNEMIRNKFTGCSSTAADFARFFFLMIFVCSDAFEFLFFEKRKKKPQREE
jgi:hypothetical protein